MESAEATSVDEEVRRLISLLLTQHVRSWYLKISHDEELFAQLHDLFDHIHLTLAGRVQAQDWDHFAIYHLPEIVLRHLEDFNIAKDRVRSNLTLEEAFLRLQSHRGINEQELYMMDISDALLIVLLPENELVSDLAYGFTRELLSELILKTLVDRLSEPWFWDELMLKIEDVFSATDWHATTTKMLSNLIRALLMTPRPWHFKTRPPAPKPPDGRKSLLHRMVSVLARIYHGIYSDRPSLYDTAVPGIIRQVFRSSKSTFILQIMNDVVVPVADLVCGDKLISSIQAWWSFASDRQSMARIIKFVRHILFPNDEPSPSRVVPTEEEQACIRLKVQDRLPSALQIDFMESKLINKVLILNILDAILGTIFPELQKRTPEQLKAKVVRIRQANLEATGNGGIQTVKSLKLDETRHLQENNSMFFVQPSPTFSVTSENDNPNGNPSTGLESTQAMKRSFEIMRRHDVNN